MDRRLTHRPHGHILTNIGCWSHDAQWIVYDTRSDAAGSRFDGTTIERVHVASGTVEVLYRSQPGAHCGVATCCPVTDRVVFILGPEPATDDWPYAANHRRGVIVRPGSHEVVALDAMCYAQPFVPGALRGGSHVHSFDARGQCVAFTYEDHVLAAHEAEAPPGEEGVLCERNQRSVGISTPLHSVTVHAAHQRNHSGSHFSALLTRTCDRPRPASDDITRAVEDAWIGHSGYRLATADTWQPALAFLGEVTNLRGQPIMEVFVVDVPSDLTIASDDGPLQGTASQRPRPPRGAHQRRLTHTEFARFPGVCAPRHWPRSSPDGSLIFFLMRDDTGLAQIHCIAPTGGTQSQVTSVPGGVTSAFSVSANGRWLAHTAEGCVCATEIATGRTLRLTEPRPAPLAPRPEACVFAPNGTQIAYVRPVLVEGVLWNQVCIVETDLDT